MIEDCTLYDYINKAPEELKQVSNVSSQEKNTKIISIIEPNEQNQIIFYNRVPKCASTLTLKLIRSIKTDQNYTTINDIKPGQKVNTV